MMEVNYTKKRLSTVGPGLSLLGGENLILLTCLSFQPCYSLVCSVSQPPALVVDKEARWGMEY